MTLFFSSTFWALTICDIHFWIWKMLKLVFMGSPLGLFWSIKYLNFGGESCEDRILSRSIPKTYTLRKVKNQVLLFQSSWGPNLSDLMVYIHKIFGIHPETSLLINCGKISSFPPKKWGISCPKVAPE